MHNKNIFLKNKEKVIRIHIKSKFFEPFEFKKETFLDKLFKNLGVTSELQFDDPSFNKEIYIISDNDEFYQNIKYNYQLQKLIRELFKLKVTKLISSDNELTIEYFESKIPDNYNKDDYKNNLKAILIQINKILENIKLANSGNNKTLNFYSNFKIFAYVFCFISIIIYAFTYKLMSYLRLTDYKLIWHSLYFSQIIFLPLLIILMKKFIKKSIAHFALLINFFIVLPSIFIWVYLTIFYINSNYDNSPNIIAITTVKSKNISKRKNTKNYYIYVENMFSGEKDLKLYNSDDLYDQLNIGDKVKIILGNGYLGYRWIKQVILVKESY